MFQKYCMPETINLLIHAVNELYQFDGFLNPNLISCSGHFLTKYVTKPDPRSKGGLNLNSCEK